MKVIANGLGEHRVDAVLLVRSEQWVHGQCKRQPDRDHGREVPQLRARRDEHGEQRGQEQHRGAEVGLDEDQRHRDEGDRQRQQQSQDPPVVFAVAKVARQRQHPRDLRQLRRLEVRDDDVDPPAGAVAWSHDRFRHPRDQDEDEHHHHHRQQRVAHLLGDPVVRHDHDHRRGETDHEVREVGHRQVWLALLRRDGADGDRAEKAQKAGRHHAQPPDTAHALHPRPRDRPGRARRAPDAGGNLAHVASSER